MTAFLSQPDDKTSFVHSELSKRFAASSVPTVFSIEENVASPGVEGVHEAIGLRVLENIHVEVTQNGEPSPTEPVRNAEPEKEEKKSCCGCSRGCAVM